MLLNHFAFPSYRDGFAAGLGVGLGLGWGLGVGGGGGVGLGLVWGLLKREEFNIT